MTYGAKPFAVSAGEGTTLPIPFGGSVTIKAHTSNTNGSLAVLEFIHPPKAGPAAHTHLREDEVWFVLEGDYRFKVGEAMSGGPRAAWSSVRGAQRMPSRTSGTHRADYW